MSRAMLLVISSPSTESTGGPIHETAGIRTAAAEAVRTQCLRCERLAQLYLLCPAGLSCASCCSRSFFYSNFYHQINFKLGYARAPLLLHVAEVVGDLAGRERHHCTPKHRTAKGRPLADWRVGRHAAQRWPVGWGVMAAGRPTVAGAVGRDRRTRARVVIASSAVFVSSTFDTAVNFRSRFAFVINTHHSTQVDNSWE